MLNSPTACPGRRSAVPFTVCRFALPCLPAPRIAPLMHLQSPSQLSSSSHHPSKPSIPRPCRDPNTLASSPPPPQPPVHLRRRHRGHVTGTATGASVECDKAQSAQGMTGHDGARQDMSWQEQGRLNRPMTLYPHISRINRWHYLLGLIQVCPKIG